MVAWGSRVIPPSPTSLRALECMLCQAKGRSQYVSPMGFPSGAYALGSHFATGPSRLGSHWLSLLGVSWGVDLRTPAVMAGASGPRKIGHTPWPATSDDPVESLEYVGMLQWRPVQAWKLTVPQAKCHIQSIKIGPYQGPKTDGIRITGFRGWQKNI